ncbi:MAG: tetratricopeptide repeat protein, partial [Alphaproteobacteria bacterium]|nr:tetratricopeptide repeat protein [Alphaproteobacteria bacterium]
MSKKNKIILLLCFLGVFAGYAGGEWIVPRYFHPASETKLTPQDIIIALGQQTIYYRQTATGNYLASQHAQRQKDWEKASDYLARVLEKDADNIELQKHAMVLAMGAGQVGRAISLAKEIYKEEPENLLAALFSALQHFETENYLAARESLSTLEEDNIASFIVPILNLWIEAAEGKFDLSDLEENPFYAYHTMQVGNYINRGPEAILFANDSLDKTDLDIRDVSKLADMFAVLGKKEEALELYQILKNKGVESKEMKEKLAVIEDQEITAEKIKELIPFNLASSPKEGVALVFQDMAEILFREKSDDSAVIFAQMALYLNPSLERSLMLIGGVLARHERYEQAIDYFEKIKPDQHSYKTAQRNIADLYVEQENQEQAIKVLEGLYTKYEDIDYLIQIGDIYRYEESYKESVEAYRRALAKWEEEDSDIPAEYWFVLYARGMAYERLKDYQSSEEDLLQALEHKPNHPYLLNYLAYSWADQGKNLEKALDMLRQASSLMPDDGYIA